MAASDLLSSLFRLGCDKLSKKEKLLLETMLFSDLYQVLKESYIAASETNHQLKEKHSMIKGSIIRGLINDLLMTNEYSLQGLANYTGYPEDVICDVAAGMNKNPTLVLSARIIELHAMTRREFYDGLVKKVIAKLSK
jgi:hypothetical protein